MDMKPGVWVGWTHSGRAYTGKIERINAARQRVFVVPHKAAFGRWVPMAGLWVLPEIFVYS